MSEILRKTARFFLSPDTGHKLNKAFSAQKQRREMKKYFGCCRAMEALQSQCIKNAVTVSQPVALISQAGRSGGTLLSQLFDGHPQCHAHPYEFRLGGYKDFNWPAVDPAMDLKCLFEELFEHVSIRLFRDGYSKGGKNQDFPFYLLPNLQRTVFLNQFKRQDIKPRDVFNAYMTSYFNAWINNRNLGGDKKIVTGFWPWVLMNSWSVENFFYAYPDGYIISLIREPGSWYASMKGYWNRAGRESDISRDLTSWVKAVKASMRCKELFKDQVLFLKFEDLITNTEGTLFRICKFLGISFDEVMLEPTFNCLPVGGPNTSLSATGKGVMNDPLKRASNLEPAEAETVKMLASGTYHEALKLIDSIEEK